MYIHTYIPIYLYTHMHIYIQTYIYIYVCILMYICTYVHLYMMHSRSIHTHTHTHRLGHSQEMVAFITRWACIPAQAFHSAQVVPPPLNFFFLCTLCVAQVPLIPEQSLRSSQDFFFLRN